jgi:hypothetical protein
LIKCYPLSYRGEHQRRHQEQDLCEHCLIGNSCDVWP